MSKRFVLSGVVLLLALVVIVGFLVIHKKAGNASNPIKAIPSDASIIIQVNDFHNFRNNLFNHNQVFALSGQLEPIEALHRQLQNLDSLGRMDSDFAQLLYNRQHLISGHFIGGRKTNFLFVSQIPESIPFRKAIQILATSTQQDLQSTERKYEGTSIFGLKTNTNTEHYISEIEGNLLISQSVILIENALRQYSMSRSLLSDPRFVEIAGTAGKSKDANIYINLVRFPGLLSVIANPSFASKMKEYEHFGHWLELDLNASSDHVMLNGFVSKNHSDATFQDIFKDNTPINISADMVLPAFISTFYTFGAEDMILLNQGFQKYLSSVSKKESRANQLTAFDNKYGFRLDELFLELIDNEITLAYGAIPGARKANSTYVVLKCKSGKQARDTFKELSKKVAQKQGKNPARLHSSYSVDRDTKFDIGELPLKDVTGLVFGGMFSINTKSYYTVLGNYLVISDSKKGLGEFLYSNVLSKTLSTNEAYKSFNSNIAQKSYFLYYSNLSKASSALSRYLDPKLIANWELHFDLFQRIQPIGLQITEVSNRNYINLLALHQEDTKGKPQTVWESLLDTTFSMKPQLVENHYTKQNEIFLQDDGNTIYLINKAGRILWKQKIAEPINSKVYQIDYYKNGKLQLLFSSDNYLHLIDRNGNYTERYPVRLREKATAGMALFDYEKNKNYRIFIPCTDKKVYAYTKDGSLISGWQFPGSEYPVYHSPEHFQIENKDFIVFADKYHAYILDRRGNIRVPVKELIYKSKNNSFLLDYQGSLAKSGVVTTDTSGTVIRIDFSGKVSRKELGTFGSQHFFDFKDVDTDGQKDYILLDRNELVAFNQNNTEILNFSIPNTSKQPPIYFHFAANDRKIGMVDPVDQLIYLLNHDGKLYKGFPLEGSTLFSIGYLDSPGGKFNLLVGGRNNFLYNYSVH